MKDQNEATEETKTASVNCECKINLEIEKAISFEEGLEAGEARHILEIDRLKSYNKFLSEQIELRITQNRTYRGIIARHEKTLSHINKYIKMDGGRALINCFIDDMFLIGSVEKTVKKYEDANS